MTMVMALSVTMMSCSKDDEEDNTDSVKNRQSFANKLLQNGTTFTWEGYMTDKRKEWGNWTDDGKTYVVMRFDRNSTSDTEGSGMVVHFENEWKEKFIDKSELRWSFAEDELRVVYRHEGWAPVHAEYRTSELVIDESGFHGTWFESSSLKYEFVFKKSTFTEWDKY